MKVIDEKINNDKSAEHREISHCLIPKPLFLKICLVDSQDIIYEEGRRLAQKVYHQIWNTKNLIDDNDHAVVVSSDGEILGNMNLQIKSPQKKLNSENFFGEEHWNSYFENTTGIAELSGLAIYKDLTQDTKRFVMMSLISGMHNLCLLKNIKLIVTIQKESLMWILTKSLHLPFLKNQQITIPKGRIPNDDYWNKEKPPAIYYINSLSFEVLQSYCLFLNYLIINGITVTFLTNLPCIKLSYSTFCHSHKVCNSQLGEPSTFKACS